MPHRRQPRFGDLELSSYELLEAADDAFYALDHEWRFTFVNERAEELLQRAAPELLGRSVWEEFPDAPATALYDEYHRAVREGSPVEFTLLYEALDVAWFSVRAVPYRGGLLVFFRPITGETVIEARARELAAHDRALREVATAVARGSTFDELFEVLARTTGELLGADAAGVVQVDATGRGARLVGAWSNGAPLVDAGTSFPDIRMLSVGPVLLAEQRTLSLAYDEQFEGVLAAMGYRGSLATRLRVDDRIWGALIVASLRRNAFSGEHRQQIERFAELLELALTRIADRQRLADAASKDPLTGLLNHRAFQERLAEEVQRAYRHERPLALALIDVDDFKTVNDTFGHQEGDRLLTRLAGSFAHQARIEDVVARLGGDEFALLLPDTTKDQAALICGRVRDTFGPATTERVPPTTLSVGITDLGDALTADGMIRLADGALYWSKEHGRDRVCVYDPEVVRDFSGNERAEQLARSQTLVGLRALARVIDAKSAPSRRHSDHVARLAGLLAEHSRWHAGDVGLLKEAALLHDVGKLAVPDGILLKAGRLTEGEYEQIKRHPAVGADIVGEVLLPRQAKWIRCHHERPDGRGYPAGLLEKDVPEGGALLAIAESWAAMTVSHPYQAARTQEDALRECRELRGRQFTAQAVSALEAVIASGELQEEPDAADTARRVA